MQIVSQEQEPPCDQTSVNRALYARLCTAKEYMQKGKQDIIIQVRTFFINTCVCHVW